VTVLIRPATADDLPALLALYAELHPDDPPLSAERAARLWREIVGQAGRTVLLAVVGGMAIGTADCVVIPNLTRRGRPYMLLENIVVRAPARRHGIGRRLLDAASAMAVDAGCYKVQLLSRMTRVDAHTFYEACGFQPLAQGYRKYLHAAGHP
jgi:GNAT superfamily N-acetyltransferase